MPETHLPLGRDAVPGVHWQQLKISQSGQGRGQGWATQNQDQGNPSRSRIASEELARLSPLQPLPSSSGRTQGARFPRCVLPGPAPRTPRRPGLPLNAAGRGAQHRWRERPHQGGGRWGSRGQQRGEEENPAKGLLPGFMILLIPDLTASRALYSMIKSAPDSIRMTT